MDNSTTQSSKFTVSSHPNHFLPGHYCEKPIPQCFGAPTQMFRGWLDYEMPAPFLEKFKAPMYAKGVPEDAFRTYVLANFDLCDGGPIIPMWLWRKHFEVLRDYKVKPLPKKWSPDGTQHLQVQTIEGTDHKGLFTTEAFKAGDTILLERPIQVQMKSFTSVATMTPDEVYDALFDRLSPDQQQEFLSLRNCQDPAEADLCQGIARTSSREIKLSDSTGKRTLYEAIFPTISNINHSCGPNVEALWKDEYFAMELRALCDVPIGAELNMAFIKIEKPRAERQWDLYKWYKIICTCPHCNDSESEAKESDDRRAKLVTWEDDHGSIIEWESCPSYNDVKYLNCCLEAMELALKEGLHNTRMYWAFTLALVYCQLADAENTIKYAKISLPWASGVSAEQLMATNKLIEGPQELPIWGRRAEARRQYYKMQRQMRAEQEKQKKTAGKSKKKLKKLEKDTESTFLHLMYPAMAQQMHSSYTQAMRDSYDDPDKLVQNIQGLIADLKRKATL